MNKKVKRIIAIILFSSFVFVSFFSQFYIVKESNHECSGNHCSICSTIHTVKHNLEQILLGGNSFFLVAAKFMISLTALYFVQFVFLYITPVNQKVRMNN